MLGLLVSSLDLLLLDWECMGCWGLEMKVIVVVGFKLDCIF